MSIPSSSHRFRLAAVFVSLALAAAVPLLAQENADSEADQAAIRDVVQKYEDARDHRDRQALESLLTEDADQLVSSGEWRRGRAELVSGMLASSQRNPGERTITVEAIRFLAPDLALADGRYVIAGAAGDDPRNMWTSILLSRQDGDWRIAAIRNMRPSR